MIKTGLLAIAITCLSFLLGFARDLSIASKYGSSHYADIIFIALLVPMLMENIFGIAMRDALVSYLNTAKQRSEMEMRLEALRIGRPLMALSLIMSLMLVIAPETFLALLVPGWTETQIGNSIAAFQIGAFTIILTIWAYFLNAALYLFGNFLLPLGRSIFLNFGALFGIWVLDASPATVLMSIVIALALHLAWLQIYLGGYGFFERTTKAKIDGKPVLSVNWVKLAKVFLPLLAATMAIQINVLAERLFASWLEPGTVAQLSYAYRITTIPLTIYTLAVLSIVFTSLTKHQGTGDLERWRSEVGTGVSVLMLMMIPSSAFFIGFAQPVVEVLLLRGAFTANDVVLTASMVRSYAAGLPFIALTLLLTRIALSSGKTGIIIWAGLICVIVTLALDALLVNSFGGAGLASAMAIGAAVNAIILLVGLSRVLSGTFIVIPILVWMMGGGVLTGILLNWPPEWVSDIWGIIMAATFTGIVTVLGAITDGHLRGPLIAQFSDRKTN